MGVVTFRLHARIPRWCACSNRLAGAHSESMCSLGYRATERIEIGNLEELHAVLYWLTTF